MIGRSGERGSGIPVLTARHDDDDDIALNRISTHTHTHTYIYIYYRNLFQTKNKTDYDVAN